MTIAVGVSCRTGAALVTDSMTMRCSADGVEGFLSAAQKIGQTGSVAYVYSGGAAEGTQLDPAPAVGFVSKARALYAAIMAASRGAHEFPVEPGSNPAEIGRLGEQDVIAATTGPGALRMAKLTKDGEEWAGPEGAIYVAGAPTLWARDLGLEDQPAPETPKGCADLAVKIASDFIAHAYGARTLADFAAVGLIPPVAYPLHLMVITDTAVDRFEWAP